MKRGDEAFRSLKKIIWPSAEQYYHQGISLLLTLSERQK